jgi:hypothetical protein
MFDSLHFAGTTGDPPPGAWVLQRNRYCLYSADFTVRTPMAVIMIGKVLPGSHSNMAQVLPAQYIRHRLAQ